MCRRPLAAAVRLPAVAGPAAAGDVQVDLDRPRHPAACDTPVGVDRYVSTQRCLDERCGNAKVANERLYVGDHHWRRRNPCDGRDPTSFDGR